MNARWALRSRASSPAPSIRADFRRLRNCVPIRQMRNHAPIMADHTLAVENRQFKPRKIGPVTGGPYDRFDSPVARSMPSRGESSTRVGGGRCGGSAVSSKPFSRAHSSIRSNKLPILRSDSVHMLRSDPAKCALPPSLIPAQATNKFCPDRGQGVEIEGRSIGSTGKLQRGNPSRSCNIVAACPRPDGRPCILINGLQRYAARSTGY